MSDELIQAAAERLKIVRGDGGSVALAYPDGSHRDHMVDLYLLSDESLDYRDQTPLSELTPEQWEELGFEVESIDEIAVLSNRPSCLGRLQFWKSRGSLVVGGWEKQEITTLGQLRHLLAALGGGE